MVTVTFKLAEREPLQLDIENPIPLEELLELCSDRIGEPLGSVLAIRAGKVCGKKELIHSSDSIDLFPAISGG